MINVFVLQNGRLSQVNIETREDLEKTSPIWVDLTDPSDEERGWVREIYGVILPDEDEVKDIEASARYYEADNGDLHLRSDFLLEENEGESRVVTVAFILARDLLFSMHNDDLPVFRLVRLRARSRPGSIGDFKDVLLDLYATDVEYSADALEGIYLNLEEFESKGKGEIEWALLSQIQKESIPVKLFDAQYETFDVLRTHTADRYR